ncbi:MAG: hypothetical protein U0704_02250 [Candidatus Eisenbacteria bacterium]
MSEPLRADEPGDAGEHAFPTEDELLAQIVGEPEPADPGDLSVEELRQRAREAAEAEYAVTAVMAREEQKAAARAKLENRRRHASPLRRLLLVALLLFNAYIWMSSPRWLEYRTPPTPPLSYYESSYKIAIYMQRQRVEEFRAQKGRLPLAAKQAGTPVKGVEYKPLDRSVYELRAGTIVKRIRYVSTDSITVFLGRTLAQMGLLSTGGRR